MVREPFLLVNEVSAPRAEMERLRLLLARKTFSCALRQLGRHHQEPSRERTDLRKALLAEHQPPPRIKAPRPNLALMFRKLPEKKHNASKGGDFASINPSRGRGPHRHQWCEPCPTVFPPFEAREARSSPRTLLQRYCAACTLLDYLGSCPGHEAGHINQKKMKPIVWPLTERDLVEGGKNHGRSKPCRTTDQDIRGAAILAT